MSLFTPQLDAATNLYNGIARSLSRMGIELETYDVKPVHDVYTNQLRAMVTWNTTWMVPSNVDGMLPFVTGNSSRAVAELRAIGKATLAAWSEWSKATGKPIPADATLADPFLGAWPWYAWAAAAGIAGVGIYVAWRVLAARKGAK